MLGLGLSIPCVAVRGGITLSQQVASLFSASEPGVWYDPSDISTLFQDSAGTTPVTAVEQPVGLMLDKSKGLARGAELVVNGDFSSGVTGWDVSQGSISGGVYSYSGGNLNGGAALISQSGLLLLGGRTYELTYQVISVSGTVSLRVANGGTEVAVTNQVVAAGSYRQIVTLSGDADRVSLVARGSGVSAVATDNISVRELPGNHAYQTTTTSRPVLSARVNLLTKTDNLRDAAWAKQSGTSVNVTPVPDPNGALTAWFVVGNGDSGIFQGLSGTASLGQTTRSVYMRTRSGAATVLLKDPAQTQGIVTCNLTTTWQRFTLTETTTPTDGFSAGIWIDDIPATGIEIAQPDLRPANQAHLPYQRVNTATDYDTVGFPHYLRFDGVDDWLVTNTITPGTDKAQVFAGVRKLSTSDATLVELSANTSTTDGSFILRAPGNENRGTAPFNNYSVYLRGTSNSGYHAKTYTAPHTGVVAVSLDIAGANTATEIYPRVNAATPSLTLSEYASFGAGTGTFGNYPLYIGCRGGTSLPFNGHLYSLIVRFGNNLPAATIEKTEKYINTKTRAY